MFLSTVKDVLQQRDTAAASLNLEEAAELYGREMRSEACQNSRNLREL